MIQLFKENGQELNFKEFAQIILALTGRKLKLEQFIKDNSKYPGCEDLCKIFQEDLDIIENLLKKTGIPEDQKERI